MSTPLIRPAAIIALSVGLVLSPHAMAQGVTGSAAIMKEIKALKDAYEKKTAELEAKIRALEAQKSQQTAKNKAPAGRRIIKDNSFNPSIGLVLNGKASSFTRKPPEIWLASPLVKRASAEMRAFQLMSLN